MDSVYAANKNSKTRQSFHAFYPSDINSLVSWYLKTAQDESRKVAHETSIGAMYINAMTKYVIGPGLVPNASPRNALLGWSPEKYDKFTAQAEAFFNMMADSGCDFYGNSSFYELQQIAFKNILIAGDILLHRCYDTPKRNYRPKVQIISGTWVGMNPGEMDTKHCVAGVVRDSKGREVGYLIKQTDYYLNDNYSTKRVNRYSITGFEEFKLVKLFGNEANQVRGVPFLHNIKGDIIDISTFTNAHLYKAMVSSLLAAVITKGDEAESESSFFEKTAEAAKQAAEDADDEYSDNSAQSIALGYGNIFELEKGEHIETVESKIAGPDYSSFLNSRLDIMGGAVNMPREMATGQYNSSYSAARGTIGATEKGLAPTRNNFAEKVCTPIYEQIVDYGIRKGFIDCPEYFESEEKRKAILAVSWIGPNPVVINPVAEVNAGKIAVETGITTRENLCQTIYGKDFAETSKRLQMEKKIMDGLKDGDKED